jgi:hypothetical protein
MAVSVLVDSSVYISLRYPQDRNHDRALRAVAALGGPSRLTLNAALEVAHITREKLGEIVKAVYSRTEVRSQEVSPGEKRTQVTSVLRALDAERRLGTFTKVVEDYCLKEIREARDDLRLLPEWVRDEVRRVALDVLAFSAVKSLRELPGCRTKEDLEYVKECEDAIGDGAITGARDRKIFYDVVVTAREGMKVIFATFDKRFAGEAKMAIKALEAADLLVKGTVEVYNLTTGSPTIPPR